MDEKIFYTKGDLKTMVSRINQVHTITMYCPTLDEGVLCLKTAFNIMLPSYKTDDNHWMGVPAIDALNVFLFANSFGNGSHIDMKFVSVISGSLKMFTKLKYINFEFSDEQAVLDDYNNALKKKDARKIYNVDRLEFNLSDMFSQEIIDAVNKVMMMNGLISNSYLDRKFKIDFTFDEYISFMDMFLGNNGPMLNNMDKNICEYFRTFPNLVNEQKPNIRLITNYWEL